jgi:hypothetical protein
MTIRSDTYSSVAEITAYTRHLLDGQASYNSTTRPTLAEVEATLNRISGVLNLAISGGGYSPSAILANSTAKLACDDWVTVMTAQHVELTQRGTGYSEAEGSRVGGFRSLYPSAADFVKSKSVGFVNLGITPARRLSGGLAYTGMTAQADRADPSDSTLEQPLFERRKFDNPEMIGEDDA